MAELKVGTIDVVAAVNTGGVADRITERGPAAIRYESIVRGIRCVLLNGDVRPENKGVAAIEPMFQVEIDTMILSFLDAGLAAGSGIGRILPCLSLDGPDTAVLLIDGDMLAVKEIASVDLCLRAKGIPVIRSPRPDRRHPAIAG